MTVVTVVERDGDRAVVVKRSPAATVERLRREGERLRRASHPGVVQVLRSAPDGDGWELRTAHAGRPLSTLAGGTAAQVAALIAAVASTLADLHALGIVHGRLDASHVLVGEQGRPVLCGFGEDVDARPEDDVAAVGRLLSSLLARDDDGEPIPERWWRPRPRWSGWERRALLLLADQACAEPATRRPSARRLAAAITEAVPDVARVDVRPSDRAVEPADGDTDPIEQLRASAALDPPERAARPVGIVLAVAGVGLLTAFGLSAPGSDGPPPPPVVSEVPSSATSSAPTVRTARPVTGSVLTVDGRRYRVGQPGDELLVDDWDCDGSPTPALLRPATGEVFVFPTWADDGQLEVAPALQVASAEALVSPPTAGGCPSLLVRTPTGDVPVMADLER